MATKSTAAPPNATDDKTQNPASELLQPAIRDKQDAKAAVTTESSTPSVFVNSEPKREEQVQNAVKFLSHPKVKGSPVMYRRSFLEKKGLTKEEIDEAFRRVPDPPPTATGVQATSTNQDGQLKPASTIQPQAPTQSMQLAAPGGGISKAGPLTHRLHWSHAFLAVGLLAASGAGTAVLFKNTVVPRLKSWIRKVVLEGENDSGKKINLKPSLAEEAAAAAAAAVDAAKASQEMLNSKNAEKRYFEEFMNLLGVQVQEMKSMSNAIRKLEGQSSASGRIPLSEQDDYRVSVPSVKQPNANGIMDVNNLLFDRKKNPRLEPSTKQPNANGIMDVNSLLFDREKNPRLEPSTKPWEVGQAQYSSSHVHHSQSSSEGMNSKVQENGLIASMNGDSPVPWWQQKNARITEIETEDKLKPLSYVVSNEKPAKRSWVPPQPPPVAMPEAAAAIRQTKPLFRKEQTADDRLSSHSPDGPDELQRIQKLSESGGLVEINGGSSEMNSSEIQEEEY